jgi:putative hemolysin
MSGIVTLEDLVEELVGEIFSEHERDAGQSIRPEGDGSVLVDGSLTIRDVNRELDLELPDDGSWSTLAGLVLALAQRIPAAGETFSLPSGVRLEVVDASPRRIRTVRVRPPAPTSGEPE